MRIEGDDVNEKLGKCLVHSKISIHVGLFLSLSLLWGLPEVIQVEGAVNALNGIHKCWLLLSFFFLQLSFSFLPPSLSLS